jgi:hypothetical protein
MCACAVQGKENLWLVGEKGFVWLIYADATLYWWVRAATAACCSSSSSLTATSINVGSSNNSSLAVAAFFCAQHLAVCDSL